MAFVITIKVSDHFSKLICPRSRPLFKAKPEVVTDPVFKKRLEENLSHWKQIREFGLDVLTWWELVVKPGVKKLLIERGKEMTKDRAGEINFLQLRQSYLVRKVQSGQLHRLAELKSVQLEIELWHERECDKIKIMSRTDEIDQNESVRIYHHELHSKQIKRSSILKLKVADKFLEGHDQCAQYLEQTVADLLLHPAHLDEGAQEALLREVQPVFTSKDNTMLKKAPDKEEVKLSVWSSNLHAAPGSDGLTTFLYQQCWDVMGDSLTEVTQSIHQGSSPTLSQRTSLMVFGSKPKKPNSIIPSDKRRISLLNSDFKVVTGIDANRFKKVATHTLSPCQLAAGNDRRIHHGINKARDAIWAVGQRGEGAGILDNDYQAAFDFMVLLWVFKVLVAKGLDPAVVQRLKNIYNDNITIVVVNNIPGKSFKNLRWSIRQGDRPSSILFNYGIDPHLCWLDKRLKGIPIYKQPASGPLLQGRLRQLQPLEVQETYKVIGYVDDVKPSITSMNEFILVDQGSTIFEKASGCILHRNPASGKVKLLPLGRWKGVLQQEDLPIKYIKISEQLDMVGVQLCATPTQTRQVNGEKLQEKVKNTIGPWKGGKFMPLTQRPFSTNTFCLSKLWFRSASLNLRESDFKFINCQIKSWVFADQLEYPQEVVLHRPRDKGGLNLINVKFKAAAEMIRSFLETALIITFRQNLLHSALYQWNVLNNRDIPNPGKHPYLTEDMFSLIQEVKEEGLLNLANMKSGTWYKVLMENKILMQTDVDGTRNLKPCRAELNNPLVDWDSVWALANIKGLDSTEQTFLWKMLHNLLPTQARLFHLKMKNALNPNCILCDVTDGPADLTHTLLTCPLNKEVTVWLMRVLHVHLPDLEPRQVVLLDLGHLEESLKLPIVWIIANTLSLVWDSRKEKKKPGLHKTRSFLEAKLNILRKTRYKNSATILEAFPHLSLT